MGGGTTYIRAQKVLADLKGENADEQTGINIVCRAIEEPLRQIVANAGGEGAVVVDKVREGEGDYGYNARKDVYEDMRKAVTLIAGRAKTACSGNVTRENIARLRDIGIDYVSSGALTHSAPILDLSMKHLRPLTAEEA